MKRDLDLIRHLLLQIESGGRELDHASEIDLIGSSEEAAGHALTLMHQRKLINAEIMSEGNVSEISIFHCLSLTWEGHDFLDTVRDDKIWRETKDGLAAGGGFTLDLAKALAKGLIKNKIEKHTGVELEF